MKHITILNERENPLFNRKEIELNIKIDISPKITEAEEFISKHFATNPENVKVKKIEGRFGSKEFIITANIYKSKEDKDNTEQKSKKEIEAEKKAEEEKSKVEQASAETKQEEKSEEEPKGE